jgi:hypothetical protein
MEDTFKMSIVDDEDNEIEVEVEFEYEPEEIGGRDSWGAPIEPDYPASVGILSMKVDGKDIGSALFEKNKKEAEERAWKFMEGEKQSYLEGRADYLYECEKDRRNEL